METKIRHRTPQQATFDVNPTNPQSRHYRDWTLRIWVTSFDLIRSKPSNTTDHHSRAQANTSSSADIQVACINSTDGKGQGMLISERMNFLHNAFHEAKKY
eukprot:1018179-Pelagomonas_calceolata.AAC.1